MLLRPFAVLLFLALAADTTAFAQPALTLADAIARAKAHNPDAGSAAAAEREAAQRVTVVRGGRFPKVDASESWQSSNHPVFVFSSLLAQRQFTAADFALDKLNHPDATSNFRAAVTVEQPLFDRVTASSVKSAEIGHDMAKAGKQLADQDLTAEVTEAFGRVLTAAATVRVTGAAIETARADRELAGNRRDAGRATDADVLQLDVYVARAREQQVQAVADERIARARLNQLMGEPLATMFSLDPAPPAIAIDTGDASGLEAEALKNRPEVALAAMQQALAAAAVDEARAAFLPQVAAQGGWELNGGTWNSRSSSWAAGAVARINVFHGFADRARLAEAREQASRRVLEKEKAESLARLDVQIAIARLEAARASEAVGRAAVDQAMESRRIIRDRYESSLTDAATLLHAAEAVQQAEAQQIAAQVNVLTATAAVQRALGRP